MSNESPFTEAERALANEIREAAERLNAALERALYCKLRVQIDTDGPNPTRVRIQRIYKTYDL